MATKKKQSTPAREGVVATDGGPVLLGSTKALSGWTGALPDMPPRGDYHDATQVRGVGALRRAAGPVIVLRSHERSVDVVHPGDGVIWLILAGTIEDAWTERASLRFEPLGLTLAPVDAPFVLLDAAYPLKAAAAKTKRLFSLETKKVGYTLELGKDDGAYVVVVRLVPS